jgi:coenzyme F420 biosynthesis associated uncharacterized protein
VPGTVDWGLAEGIAHRLAGHDPFARSYHAASLTPDFVELTAEAEELVAEHTGLRSLHGPARARVVDRPAWISANVASFQRLLRPILTKLDREFDGGGLGSLPKTITGKVAGAEVGTMLGWMSGRVLGQYDLLVVDDENATDQDVVYYVGPNILSLEKRFGFPPREFRLWIALHEVTHRAQFTGVPWLRPYFLGLVEDALGSVEPDAKQLLSALRDSVIKGPETRRALDEGGLVALLSTPEQRAVLARIGGLMSLLEGHGDVTMDRAATGRVPSAERFSRVLRERRNQVSAPVRVVQKLTGLSAKLAQYEQGERFLAAIEAAAGPRAVDRCWEGPEQLPTLDEIRAPERWLARVTLPTAAA